MVGAGAVQGAPHASREIKLAQVWSLIMLKNFFSYQAATSTVVLLLASSGLAQERNKLDAVSTASWADTHNTRITLYKVENPVLISEPDYFSRFQSIDWNRGIAFAYTNRVPVPQVFSIWR